MLLDLKKVFLNEGQFQPFEHELDMSEIEISGAHPFVSPVHVAGEAQNRAGTVRVVAKVEFNYRLPCDRCTKEVETPFSLSFTYYPVLSLTDESDDRFVLIKDYKLDIDELVREDVLLELPTKYLCSEDCKGLCPVCGADLNKGSCGCETHQTDPRLEVLKKLIDS